MAPKRARDASGAPAAAEAKKAHIRDDNKEAIVPETSLHDEFDEELDNLGIPVGWSECPRMGKPIFRFIPMKVPLGPQFDVKVEPKDRFTVDDAIMRAQEEISGIVIELPVPPTEGQEEPTVLKLPATCNMVIDLTNSSRYYRSDTFQDNGVKHVKIPNKGRGEAPIPAAVNDFVFTVFSHLSEFPEAYILVHCTHGYNRTGFMIASYIMRMLSTPTTKLPDVLKSFADARSPGIYKDYYVQYLFRYYHERPPRDYPPPSLPPWKAQASPDDGNDDGEFDDSMFRGAEGRGMHHDDHLGENISKTEGDWVRSILMQYILDREGVPSHRTMFPGSQPVSLARSNLDMLFKRRYWVTWKADGTRYLILIHRTGTYLIDRSNAVTRVQMRWPTPLPPWRPGCPRPDAPVGPFHVGTILDGEMVVDVDKATGICTRRFLAYDMMVLNGEPCLHQPWGKRWAVLKDYVENPRRFEQEEARKGKYRLRYDYAQEEFRFRRKDFWPLHMAHKVIHQFIPKAVCHEADGLILQPYADAYVPLTCDELLKWKFAHMNSVDFKLIVSSEGGVPVSKLQLLHPQKGGMAVLKFLEGAKVVFDKGEKPVDDPRELNTRIIECAWDPERQAWSFMRERRDKQYPNAFPVYELVVASIKDNIQDSDLLKTIDEAVKGDVYDEDMGRKKRPPAAAPQEMPANSAAAADGGDGQP